MSAAEAERIGRLRQVLGSIDLTSADGRAGIRTLLREIEAACPGEVERATAMIQLARVADVLAA